MNKKLLVTIILYYSSFAHSFAFHPDTLSFIHPVVFDHAFSVLESNRIETGILYDYGITPVEFSDYDGSVGNNQKANIYDIYYLLKGISSSIINYNQLPPNASEMVTSMSNSFISTSAIPIGIVLYKYNRFCNDAITSGKLRYYAQNEIVEDVYDPNNNWINPYTDSYVFAFSPYQNIVGQSVSFDFNTIFRFTNQTIVNLQFDSGNGVFQTVGTSPISVNYTSASTKHLRLKATLSDNTVLFAYSDLVVPLVEETTSTSGSSAVLNVETFTSTIPSEGKYPQAVISTRFAGGSTTMTKQPLIVVEGFDPLNYGDGRYVNGFTNITRFENSHNTFLNDYDLVYIDWKQSTASIESNADILKQVIAWVNNRKPNGFRSILIGQSMGGLIARYALKTMENAHIDHQVACFVSDDTPHLGANIPLGLLFTAQHAFESLDDHLISHVISDFIALWDNLFDANNYGTIRSQLRAIRNGESVRQMLYNYVNEDYEIDNTMYNSFQTTLRNLGFPQGDSYGDLRLLSITNGGDNTFTTSSPILDVSMNGDIGFGSRLVFWGLASLLFRTTSLLPFVGPSNSTVEIHAKAYPFTSSGAKVYESSAVYSKHLLWTTLEIPLFSHEHYAGTGLLPIDNAFGSFYSNEPIPDTTFCQPFWFEFELNSDLQRFMFVPSVSSLCYKNGNPLQSTDYTTDFCMTGINMDNIPFEGYRFHQDTATYHTSLSESDLNWVTSIQHLTIQDTILSNHDRQFSINDSAFTPVLRNYLCVCDNRRNKIPVASKKRSHNSRSASQRFSNVFFVCV